MGSDDVVLEFADVEPGADSGVLDDFLCEPELLADPLGAELAEAAVCVRSARIISLI